VSVMVEQENRLLRRRKRMQVQARASARPENAPHVAVAISGPASLLFRPFDPGRAVSKFPLGR
jgi:hypothetical protein